MLQPSLVQFLSYGTAKTKLAIFAFLYSGEFMINSIGVVQLLYIFDVD